MLHYKDLNKLIFEDYPRNATSFVALTWYVWPAPISKLQDMPFDSTVIYGLFKENKKRILHDKLLSLNSESLQILYPDLACHSKCYIWYEWPTPIKWFIWSANFSSNWLYNDYRESLYEVSDEQLSTFKEYINVVKNTTIVCNQYSFSEPSVIASYWMYDDTFCEMALYDTRTWETQITAWLNWGMNSGVWNNHTRPDDAYIPIKTEYVKKYPKLFQKKQPKIEWRKRQNEVIEIIWDDWVIMQWLLEWSQPIEWIIFPKQISSSPNKNDLWLYIRNRIWLSSWDRVLKHHLEEYWRTNIKISLIEEWVYLFDFSV